MKALEVILRSGITFIQIAHTVVVQGGGGTWVCTLRHSFKRVELRFPNGRRGSGDCRESDERYGTLPEGS